MGSGGLGPVIKHRKLGNPYIPYVVCLPMEKYGKCDKIIYLIKFDGKIIYFKVT